ncbi:MAG: PilZ domain-containing protein [Spirochaetes bacterium]|nr:PilZ domain-containing protein [Spirochaetota bacterium]
MGGTSKKKKKERRREPRVVVSYNAAIVVDGQIVPCGVVNISGHGAFVKVDSTDYAAEFVVGESIMFSLFPGTEEENRIQGEVVRHSEEDGSNYVAMYFLHEVIYQ